jgi:hypothetical protein
MTGIGGLSCNIDTNSPIVRPNGHTENYKAQSEPLVPHPESYFFKSRGSGQL